MIANCITSARIVGTAILLFLKPFSTPFYIIYLLCGISDALDGFVARLTKSASAFGAKFDSAADLFFYAVLLGKLLPTLWERLPLWIWCIVAATVALRIFNYLYAALRKREFSTPHTVWNKASGASIFLIPFFLLLPAATVPLCTLTALITCFAAAHEASCHLRPAKPTC